MFCFGSEIFENNENVNFTRLDEKTTRVRDGLLKGLISGSRCVFGSKNVSAWSCQAYRGESRWDA